VSALLIVLSLVSNVAFGPLLGQGFMQRVGAEEAIWPSAYDRTLAPERTRLLTRLPESGGVIAGFDLLSHLTGRGHVYSLHTLMMGHFTGSDRPWPVPDDAVALIADLSDPQNAAYVGPGTGARLRELAALNRLRPVEAVGDLVLFLRDARDTVTLVSAGAPSSVSASVVTFDGQLGYGGCDSPPIRIRAGGVIALGTRWKRVAPMDRLFMTQLGLFDGQGRLVAGRVRDLAYAFYPPNDWPQDSLMVETSRLVVPTGTAPGTYTLALRVLWRAGPRRGFAVADDADVRAHGGTLSLGTVDVVPGPRGARH
jgi:hypothetical protein